MRAGGRVREMPRQEEGLMAVCGCDSGYREVLGLGGVIRAQRTSA